MYYLSKIRTISHFHDEDKWNDFEREKFEIINILTCWFKLSTFNIFILYNNYMGWILQTGLLCLPVIFCLLGDDVTVSLCWVWHKAITVPCSDWWIGWQPGSQLAESVRRCEHSWLAYGPVFPHSLSCTFVIFCVFILRNYIIIMITAILLVSVATCLVSAKPTIYKVDEERNIAESILTPVSSTGIEIFI